MDTRGEAARQEDQREGWNRETKGRGAAGWEREEDMKQTEFVYERAEKKSDEEKGGWQFHYETDR